MGKWKDKPYRLVIQRQRRTDNLQEIWEGEYTYRCILTNDFKSDIRDIVEFYNLRGGKERIFDDMNNGFGWKRLPKSFMSENTVYLLMTAFIRNFYKRIIKRVNVKDFGLSHTSRIKAFVFKYISVAAKWVKTSGTYRSSIPKISLMQERLKWGLINLYYFVGFTAYCLKSLYGVRGNYT